MDSSFRLAGLLITLSLVLGSSFNLISRYNQYSGIKVLASELEHLVGVMGSLKDLSGSGGWRQVKLSVPADYTLTFNNVTDELIVSGAEDFSEGLSFDLLYELVLSEGSYNVQVYYGALPYNELKDDVLVFQ